MGLSRPYEPIHDLESIGPHATAGGRLEVDVRFVIFDRHFERLSATKPLHEIYFLESGVVTFQVADQSVTARPGDLVTSKAIEAYAVNGCGRTAPKGLLLRFSPSFLSGQTPNEETALYFTAFTDHRRRLPYVIGSEAQISSQVSELMRQLHAELPATSGLRQLAANTYLRMILLLIARSYETGCRSNGNASYKAREFARLRPVFSFVDQFYQQQITVDQAALVLGLSRSHFMRCFRAVSGEPFVSWLNRYRIGKAKVLLASTEKTILEISEEVGFSDQSHFGQLFRRLIHMTPRQYRESKAGDRLSVKRSIAAR